MKRFKVLCDNSFLQRVNERKFIIEEKFLSDKFELWLSDTTVKEFFLTSELEWYKREDTYNSYRSQNFHVHQTGEHILFEEYRYGARAVSLRDSHQSQMNLFLNDKLEDQEEKEVLWRKLEKTRRKEDQIEWNKIPVEENAILDFGNIRKEAESIIKNPLDFREYIQEILRTVPTNYTGLEHKNPWLFLINRSQPIKEIKDPENELPTFCNLIRFDIFMKNLKKPATSLARSDKNKDKDFRIELSNTCYLVMENPEMHPMKLNPIEITHLKLGKNLLPDFRTFLLALHYVDIFVTCDLCQAVLIKYLFPNDAHKVKYYQPPETRFCEGFSVMQCK